MTARKPYALSVCFVPLPRFTLSPFALMIDALRLAADEGDRSRQTRCRWSIMASALEPVIASCGTRITPFERFSRPDRFDYIVVCGGLLHGGVRADAATVRFLKAAAGAGVTLVGVCTGVFDLLRAGLMEQRRVCVSWFHYWDLLEQFPACVPVADQLFVLDGDRITCAGGAGAVDLAAWMIGRHCGAAASQKSLHIMQLDSARPPEAPQPQPPGWGPVENAHVRKALLLIEQRLSSPLSVHRMAGSLGISGRQLERTFKQALGITPRRASLLLRLRFALWLVTTTTRRLTDIAVEAGFSDLAHFSTAFTKEYGVRPSMLRSADMRALQRLEPSEFLEPARGSRAQRPY